MSKDPKNSEILTEGAPEIISPLNTSATIPSTSTKVVVNDGLMEPISAESVLNIHDQLTNETLKKLNLQDSWILIAGCSGSGTCGGPGLCGSGGSKGF